MTEEQYKGLNNFGWNERDIKGRLLRDQITQINYIFIKRFDLSITDAKSSYGREAGKFQVYDFTLDQHNPDGYHPKGRAVDGAFRGLNHFQSFLIFERWRFDGIGLYPFTMPDKIVHVDDRDNVPALRWVRNPDSYIYSLSFFEGYLREEILLHPVESEGKSD